MKEKIALISILANMILAAGKITVGLLSNSAAILADGFHSFIDIFSSAVSYFGIRISKKPADQKHPYGHYKFEVLAGVIITIILLGTGAGIIFEAYQSFLNPQVLEISYLAFGVMIGSIAISETMARLKIHFGKKENSIALLSDEFHLRIEVYTSLAVLAGLFLMKHWVYVDAILALFIGIYIIKEAFSIGKEAVDSLLDISAGEETEEKIREIVKLQGVALEDLKTQKKGSAVTASLEIKLPDNLSVKKATETSESLRKRLMNEVTNLSYITIQIKSHEVETGFYRPAFGRGFGWQRRGRFKGEVEEARGGGPGGYCACPQCGYEVAHERGVPCSTLECPNCKIKLVRK